MSNRLTRTAAVSALVAVGSIVAVSATTSAGPDALVPSAQWAQLTPTGSACSSLPEDLTSLPASLAIEQSPDLSTLAGALATAGFDDRLAGEGPFTVFAPNNGALAKIPTNVLDSILADAALLQQLLGYHVVEGQALSAADLATAGTVATADGEQLTFTAADGGLTINNSAAVVCADIPIGNGVLHIVDSILEPPSGQFGSDGSTSVPGSSVPDVTAVATPGNGPQGPACASIPAEGAGSFADMSTKSVAEAVAANPLLTQFAAALTAAGLTESLAGDGPFTVFAPSDDAFAAIPPGDLEAIMADSALLSSVLGYHVIQGQSLTAADLATAGTAATAQGSDLTFTAQADGSLGIDNSQSAVSCSNITVANGTIHIVGTLLVPPAG